MFTTIKLFQPETNHSPFLGFGWLSFFRLLIAGILLAFITMGCSKENETTPAEKPYSLALPAHFPEPVLNLASAKLSENKFILGKKLFYDGILSLDGRINCGTCHISFGAFSNPDHPTSHGIRDQFGKRNALPLQNLIWKKEYMWDGGISDLGLVAMAAIQNPVEMDEKMENVVFKVNAKPEYKSLFNKAYGSPDVTGLKLLDALSCFMVELVSGKSRYDLYVTNQPGANFTSDEVQGLELFREKCSRCHKEPFFTDNSFRNNGLDTVNRMDMGRYEITLRSVDRYKFRVPRPNPTCTMGKCGPWNGSFSIMPKMQNGIQAPIPVWLRKMERLGSISRPMSKRKSLLFWERFGIQTLLETNVLPKNKTKPSRCYENQISLFLYFLSAF